MDVASYSTVGVLRNGRRVDIRAFKPGDQDDLTAAVGRVSVQSLYRRFFTVKRGFSDKEREFFLNVDFINHVALMAWVDEAGRRAIVGGGRYVIVRPGVAEVAIIVIDQYQGQGIGAAILEHLAVVARAMGLTTLVAEVLPENAPMLKLFQKCGLAMTTTRDPEVVHVTLALDDQSLGRKAT
jgi:GNAT superfamily N-acetyltransferase